MRVGIVHNYLEMHSVDVLENELKLMDAKISEAEKKGASPEICKEKKDNLKFKLSVLFVLNLQNQTMHIQSGLLSPENYIVKLQQELTYENKLIAEIIEGDDGSNAERVRKRIELIEQEIKNMKVFIQDSKNQEPKPEAKECEEKKAEEKAEETKPEVKKTAEIPGQSYSALQIHKIDKKAAAIVMKLNNEYKDALFYLKEIGEDNSAITEGYSKLQTAIQALATRRAVDIAAVPPSITPEMLLGMSDQERGARFNSVLQALNEEKKKVAAVQASLHGKSRASVLVLVDLLGEVLFDQEGK